MIVDTYKNLPIPKMQFVLTYDNNYQNTARKALIIFCTSSDCETGHVCHSLIQQHAAQLRQSLLHLCHTTHRTGKILK